MLSRYSCCLNFAQLRTEKALREPRVDLTSNKSSRGGVDGSIALVQIAAANDSDMIFDPSLGMSWMRFMNCFPKAPLAV